MGDIDIAHSKTIRVLFTTIREVNNSTENKASEQQHTHLFQLLYDCLFYKSNNNWSCVAVMTLTTSYKNTRQVGKRERRNLCVLPTS